MFSCNRSNCPITSLILLTSHPPPDTYNLNANELVLECRVRGEPRPDISWTKDGNFIENDDKYQQFDQADGVCRLVVNNPEEKDSGVYICKAENSVFHDQVSHNVTFEGQNAYIFEKTHGYFHRDPNKPQFQNALGDHLVTAGGMSSLSISCFFFAREFTATFIHLSKNRYHRFASGNYSRASRSAVAA